MSYTRREFGKLALAGLPAAAVLARTDSIFGAFAQAKPNSLINGVQVGTITYSYRQMPDQSAEATLQYVVASGISAIELMDGPVDAWARAQTGFTPPNAGRRGGGAGAAGGGRGPGAPGGGAPPTPPAPDPTDTRSWNGQPCPSSGRRGGGAPAVAPPAGGGAGAAGAAAA